MSPPLSFARWKRAEPSSSRAMALPSRSCGQFGRTGSCRGESLPMQPSARPESMLAGFAPMSML